MRNPRQVLPESLGRPISRRVTACAVVLASVLASAVALVALSVSAAAASQPLLPFRCFAQVGVDHVVFGPDSFFLPNTCRAQPASPKTPGRRS
jgi:hypothetical protein